MENDQDKFHWVGNNQPENNNNNNTNNNKPPRLKSERGLKPEIIEFMNSTVPSEPIVYINN